MKKKDITKKVQAYLSTFAPYLKQNDEKKEKKLNEKKWNKKWNLRFFFQKLENEKNMMKWSKKDESKYKKIKSVKRANMMQLCVIFTKICLKLYFLIYTKK